CLRRRLPRAPRRSPPEARVGACRRASVAFRRRARVAGHRPDRRRFPATPGRGAFWKAGARARRTSPPGGRLRRREVASHCSIPGTAMSDAPQSRTVLVPLDLSSAGDVKISVAEQYARALGADILLLHVLRPGEVDPANVSPREAIARTYLD